MWFILCASFILAVSGEEEITTTPEPILLEPRTTVTIEQGTLEGLKAEDGDYFEFHGIPYADSTSGANRFKAPSSPPSFETIFTATRKDIKCVRALGVGYEGTEDCLVVNVFTPIVSDTANLPVMVWIKGKEFDQPNEPELSFKNFMEKDVVVVTLNYRESILGFLCLGTDVAPGNAGLKDIIAGLRWVQKNIAQFGGDPDNVSLFGHGSGAAAVDLVTLSPMSSGLIHKAIAQSGTALAPWAVTRDNLEYAIKVAESLGHIVTNVEQLSEIFTRTSVAALMAVINELDRTDNSLAFAPCLERENLEGVEPFLVKSPYQTLIDGDYPQIPLMTGFVEMEGTIRAAEAETWMKRMDTSFTEFLQPDLKFNDDFERDQVAQSIRTFYFGEQPVEIDSYLKYHGDTLMLVSSIRETYMRAASNSPVYLYQFSYKGALGESFVSSNFDVDRAAHSEELGYLFYDIPEPDTPELDLAVSDILIERWTNFAKTGEPTSESSQVVWQPFTLEDTFYIRILDDDDVTEGTLEVELRDPHAETLTFWNQIYEDHFLDAEGNWELEDRNEGEEEEEVGSGAEGSEEDENITEGTVEEGNGEENEEVTTESPSDSGSASTAVGYTFLIITVFGVLNHFHWTQILL